MNSAFGHMILQHERGWGVLAPQTMPAPDKLHRTDSSEVTCLELINIPFLGENHLIVRYTDGRAYLLDLDWLTAMGGQAETMPLEALINIFLNIP